MRLSIFCLCIVEELPHHQDQNVPETLVEYSTLPDTSAQVNGQVKTTSDTTVNPQTDLEKKLRGISK